ncbi:1,4-dihydroxy-2-naphthoate polyprenyltransferase [Streptococcus sp. CSL10205-OR2]|uniref:1,4-dihydroxy-2-naphthoate polyprenyltransferase n=1 Tax=Streptococcus sp. CSL10205-OR2 TaxID=2980558 RepID=UPI0021D8FAAB|nr:1,4-dihydroxy-2-naphthoate polyprenyltransferase [Streptococcus sp. CSL10205-OR2]MCU9533650.1 1,4-dihydroxy-2-naphthoate polyprenyltransferase [Streptococcus sp. CSL10205-OR2]
MQNKNLSLVSFLEFVELKTKVASVFPMMIGFLWSQYYHHTFNLLNSLIFIIAVISFDMCTTAINNTVDYHKAIDTSYKVEENVIGKYQLDLKQMVKIIFLLLGISIFFSLLLVFLTDILLLPMGILCFLIGIFYTYGPKPLSRLPLGEIFSGLTMGFGIFFLALYIQFPERMMSTQIDWSRLTISWHIGEIALVFLMSLPLVTLIANIMLANNLCDYEQDIKNHRYTLVHYIGTQNALALYTVLNLFPWFVWVAFLLGKFVPWYGLFIYLFFLLNWKSLKRFRKEQIKSKTFIEAIKSFVLFSALYLLTVLLGLLF